MLKDNSISPLFAVLPGSPMNDKLYESLTITKWQEIKDFHTRNRDWWKGIRKSKSLKIISYRYERDKALITKIKHDRGSNCQICGFTFTKQDGTNYSELHHLEHLSNDGLDVSSNILVLCANCHRRFHFGNVKILKHTAYEIVLEIDGTSYSCNVG
jgi:predicted HNH restriction endonuclease